MKTILNRINFLIGIMIIMPVLTFAQPDVEGKVSIYSEAGIDSLVQLHIAYNQAFPVITGYRIQVFMESGNQALSDCENIEQKFLKKYKDIPTYITFSAPYYRVRVGDFRTRLEAEKFLQRINRKYPNAWVIKDEINLPDLSTTKNQ